MKHLYGNIIASIDVETTGLISGHHEIVQIAVVPLDKDLRPAGNSFYTQVRPDFPERMDARSFEISGLTLAELMEAPSQDRARDLFTEWVDSLGMPTGKKIIPMAHNWTFEYGFLRAWLGVHGLDHFFHFHPRDAMILALAIKDKLGMQGFPIPFDSVSLTNLCKVYGITNDKPHDALADAIAEAELYRTLLGAP